MRSAKWIAAAGVVVLLAGLAAPADAQKNYDDGASDTEIRIGHTNPYSGNASAYSVIGRTIQAFFRKINDDGGVHGRKLSLITYDDGYMPAKTLEMGRKLVEEDKVLLVFNVLGTAPNSAIHRYLNQRKVPQLFAASGASKWGDPKDFPWTMGLQPNYAVEGAIYARHILATVPDAKIGVLMQNDDYGRDYLDGFKQGLGAAAARIVQVSTYEVADPTVDSQMIQLKGSGANVFFSITTPKFAAQAIRKAAEIGWRPAFYQNSVSSSFSSVFKPAGLDASQGIVLAMYRKDGGDPQWAQSPDVIAWKAFLAEYMPNADLADDGYNYGYVAANTLVQVLRQCGDDLTRESVMKQAANLRAYEAPLLLPGIKVNTAPDDFEPIQSVQLAKVKGASFELFGDVLSNERR